jgi:hypothetical protein
MAGLPILLLKEIPDLYVRENFKRLKDFFRQESPLLGFKHFELVFDAAVTNYKLRHGLGFVPKDVIQTSLTGAGVVTWNYSSFDKDSADLTVSGPCTVRFFLGTYNGNKK